ncbi:unnamed protein product [Chironomus riparius]|uniref:Phosphatidylinositol-glycan biosynthesis class F protein n=1 Tax=Chironomus riparius TaxID=315576 RepID=A0A9N9RWJ8_9DIPT|nr:unnamed protein product [Chironomus riparius]
MYWISTTERVKLNYAMTTVAAIVVYTFFVQFVPQKLWLSVLFFIVGECLKVFIVQKLYKLDTTNNMEGVLKRRRNNKVMESLKFGFVMSLTVFFFAFICIILGAPALEKYLETFTLSALLTGITLFPISLFIGVSGTISILMTESFDLSNVTAQAFLKLLKRNAYLVIFGAFIGSVVFPLDWDRPWQIYPIPNIVGAVTGQMLGSFYCLVETMVKHKLGKKQH